MTQPLTRDDKVKLALAILTLDAGGSLMLPDAEISSLPIGTLIIEWDGLGNLVAAYRHNETMQHMRPVLELALMALCHKGGKNGWLIIPGRDIDKMPKGSFGFRFVLGGMELIYAQEKMRIEA